MRLRVDGTMVTDGYRIFDNMYEKGPGTIEEIAAGTGLSRERVFSQLKVFLSHGLIEQTSSER